LSACTHCHQIPTKEFDLGGGVKFTHELAFKNGVNCAACHSELIRGNGNVPRERCIACHNRESDLVKIDDHVFMHQVHVSDHKVDCIQCHTPIEHSLQPNKIEHAASDCQSCHPNHHQQQVDLLRGVGAKTIGEQPNMMLAIRAECTTCHNVRDVGPSGAAVIRGSLQACSSCHDAATVRKFEDYHVALRNAMPALEKSTGDVEAAAKKGGLPSGRAEKISAEAADMRHDLEMLRRGNEVHNMHFAVNLVRQTLDHLTALCRELKIEPPKVTLPKVDDKPAKP
jgi:hypothetical protein